MSTQPSSTPAPEQAGRRRLGVDWTAVLVAAVIVLVALFGLLPSIPFLVK